MPESPINGRRHLLLIYIHGFMGNETSFQNFPAHVYHSLSQRLSASHTVEYIVYPRFKTRKKINVAGNDFSLWLQQHETDQTDTVLLGHSMGGLLAADVALLTSTSAASRGKVPRHRIMGVVGLDTPFLGMHPSVVAAGLGSLFRRDPGQLDSSDLSEQHDGLDAPSTQGSGSSSPRPSLSSASLSPIPSNPIAEMESLSPYASSDLFAPPDTSSPKPTTLSRALYFITKHSDNVTKASKAYLTSHFEFGSCMADYQSLMDRHDRIRALDNGAGRQRTRFVNYYTATSGRPKRPKPQKKHSTNALARSQHVSGTCSDSIKNATLESESNLGSQTPSIRLSSESELDENRSTASTGGTPKNIPSSSGDNISTNSQGPPGKSLSSPPPTPIPINAIPPSPWLHNPQPETLLSPLVPPNRTTTPPPPPSRPPPLPPQHQTSTPKPLDDYRSEEISSHLIPKASLLPTTTAAAAAVENKNHKKTSSPSSSPTATKEEKKKHPKSRHFCLLPRKSSSTGERDARWVRVPMRDVDEVGAHCGLFAAGGAHYAGFVGEVVTRIEGWVDDGGG